MSVHNSCGLCEINIRDLSVISEGDTLLEQINLDFHCGQLTALIGRNGAGKTTLLRAILGERKFTGEIRFKKFDDAKMNRPITGYVPQRLDFDRSMPLSVLDFMSAGGCGYPVWFGHKKQQVKKIKERLEAVACGHVLHRQLGNLSGGELQRVLLAMATDPMPDLLILDEPVSGMDVAGMDLFYKTVTELRDKYHLAILLVSHDLNLIHQYADKVVLLDKTVVIQGNVEEVFASEAFRKTFGLLDVANG